MIVAVGCNHRFLFKTNLNLYTMELVSPGLGLIFWMTLAFGIVFFVLAKFAWPMIVKGLKNREQHIDEALKAAERAHEEMKQLKVDNEALLMQAREERDVLLADARKMRDKLLEESRVKASEEADRIIQNAKERIENERKAAIVDMKNQIADISIEIAEKILKDKLQASEAQKSYIEKLLNEASKN